MLRLAAALLLFAAPVFAGPPPQQDSLAAARDLYTSADYGEALAMLTRLRPAATTPADVRGIEQYRAFALIALGREAEAELVVEAIAQHDPTWTLPAGEAPPRITALFARARDRALPGAVRQRLAAARALYAEKSYDAAAEAFTALLLLLEDQEVARAAGSEADRQAMTALATGFRDLSLAAGEQARAASTRQAAAVTPEPTPAATPAPGTTPAAATPGDPGAATPTSTSTAPTSPAPAPANEPAAAPATPDPNAKAPAATDIVAPVAIAQAIPAATAASVPMGGPQTILLDIVIDETGRVERAEVRRSVNRMYEAELVAATRAWRYTPATQGGRPVKYQRTLEVTLNPRQ